MPKLERAQWLWLGALGALLIVVQIGQPYPEVAPLHHIPTLAVLLVAPWLLARWPISNGALGCIVGFLLLHTLGGRYTYTHVPYDQWYAGLTGGDLAAITGWSRNHYDRLVHLAFGVLSIRPVVDVVRLGGGGLKAGLWAALAFVLAISCIYEIFEWLLTIAAGELASDYNGQQGDMWDAQKDMALALIGALTAIGWSALRTRASIA